MAGYIKSLPRVAAVIPLHRVCAIGKSAPGHIDTSAATDIDYVIDSCRITDKLPFLKIASTAVLALQERDCSTTQGWRLPKKLAQTLVLLQLGTYRARASLAVAPSKTPKESEGYDNVKVVTNEIFCLSDIIIGITGLYLGSSLEQPLI